MDPKPHSSSPREERASSAPAGVPAGQIDPGQATSHDTALSGLVTPHLAQVHSDSVRKLFDDAMGLMYPGELYRTFQERLKQLQEPLPNEHAQKVEEAIVTFRTMPCEKQVEVLNVMLSPERLSNRVAWPIPSAPIFQLPPLEKREEAAKEMESVATELLLKGTLPGQFIHHSIMNLTSLMPATRSKMLGDILFGCTAAGMCSVVALVAPWWVTGPVVASSVILHGLWKSRPDYRSEYIKGHLAESVEALAQVHTGGVIPMIVGMFTLSESFRNSEGIENPEQRDAFLISRVLRVLGRPPQEIAHYFSHQRSVYQTGNELIPALTNALAEHGVSIKTSLLETLTESGSQEQEKVLEFLELMNAAHFVWAGRDRDNLRGEFADCVLKMRDGCAAHSEQA